MVENEKAAGVRAALRAATPVRRTAGLDWTQQRTAGAAAAVAAGAPVTSGEQPAASRVKASALAQLERLLRPTGPTSIAKKDVRRPDGSAEEDQCVRYEDIILEKPIGAGSFGAVFLGTCCGEVVAVKQCKVGDPTEAAMLLLEIRYLQKLRHPRLVSFLGCCNRPPHVLMLVEYMSGGSLYALLFGATRRSLAFSAKARMAHQISEGLVYLHELSVVHRDLKTMNIVLDKELNCKICDFGLTITLERTHMTVRSLQGSPRYMAPEQFETAARITEKVDIWQMGCVMLELFCLAIPFSQATGVPQIITELLYRKRAPAVPSEADPRARSLVQACLRIEPKHRPTADVLEEALGSVCLSCAQAA